jgi:DNA-binding HxlR family transcriptional regulator
VGAADRARAPARPQRFKDLLAQLPAMGTNRLSDRLKTLEAGGAVTRTTLPAPSGASVYVLTERGEALRTPVVALAQRAPACRSTSGSTAGPRARSCSRSSAAPRPR